MPVSSTVILVLAIYAIVVRGVLSTRSAARPYLFAAANLAGVSLFFYYLPLDYQPGNHTMALSFVGYLLMVIVQHLAIRRLAREPGPASLVPLILPIAALALARYGPEGMTGRPANDWVFVGLSFMALRLSSMAMEVRNGIVEPPSLAECLGFAFFLPTIAIGPISRYSVFHRSFASALPDRQQLPLDVCMGRIVVGAAKYFFLANLFNQISFSGLLLDGHPHHAIDLVVACAAYYGFLFCNFSGFCDLAIGFSGLMGIRVEENFDNPLLARNLRDFWNRWHITLSVIMRDMLFTPLAKTLATRCPARLSDHATALAILVVFTAVGVWHGAGWNFLLFGLIHAVGVAGSHYYTVFLKARLGPERFKAYNLNPWIRTAACVTTFAYVSAAFLVFANDASALERIIGVIR